MKQAFLANLASRKFQVSTLCILAVGVLVALGKVEAKDWAMMATALAAVYGGSVAYEDRGKK